MMMRLCAILLAVVTATSLTAETVKLAVTTSFENSGLADVLLPHIERDTGLAVQLLVVGTGQAIRLGQAGDVDAIFVHARAAEEAFVADGFGTHRREIMYNDFVLVGPQNDPAAIATATTASEAFQAIAQAKAPFVSRGDESGTHKAEQSQWQSAGLEPAQFSAWYREVGAGMGASLNTAAGLDAYILADRASWLNFGNQANLALLFSGDPALFNQYAYLPVSADLHPHVNASGAERLENWLTSNAARELIDGYRIAGEALFVFNATP
ncbi:substrate-binding domain-containing protein [Yoonia sp. 208BN28-4]|uniref:substrate-binding domain-containing protein n=1 Tax=Yoonia sp. 208BN28-4 TaxID=3126505 RepID=UPI0030A99E0A